MNTTTASLCFSENRARGRLELAVGSNSGVTRRQRVHESGSLRVRFPGAPASEMEAVLINTAGGMTGGDKFDIAIAVEQNAQLVVTSASAEKIYRSLGPPVDINLRIEIAQGGTLAWLPQETILFDGAALDRRIEVNMEEGASLILFEAMVFGRSGMDEAVRRGTLNDRWRIRRNGRLIYAEGVRLEGDIAGTMAQPAVANGGVAIATGSVVPGDEAMVEAVRAMNDAFQGEVGISAWNGHALLRFCAPHAAVLRNDMACAVRALRASPLPRLWIH